MDIENILALNPLIHAPVRLAILSALITVDSVRFAFLKEVTRATDGNLSTHLSKLEKAGYVDINKEFVGKKPQTNCSITEKGREAFQLYITKLEAILQQQQTESN